MADPVSAADLARVGLGIMGSNKAPTQARPPVSQSPAPQTQPATPVAAPAPQALKWDEVVANPEVQKLSGDEFDQLRRQYFTDVVAPHVPTDEIGAAWEQFDGDTNTGLVAKAKRGASRLLDIGKAALSSSPNATVKAAPPVTAPDPTAISAPLDAQDHPLPSDKAIESGTASMFSPAEAQRNLDKDYSPQGFAELNAAIAKAPNAYERRDLQAEKQRRLQVLADSPASVTAPKPQPASSPTQAAAQPPVPEGGPIQDQVIGADQAPAADPVVNAPTVDVSAKNYAAMTPGEKAAFDAAHPELTDSATAPTADTNKLIADYSIQNNVSHDMAASEIAGIQAEAKRRVDGGENPKDVQDWAVARYASSMGSIRESTPRNLMDYLLGVISGTGQAVGAASGLSNFLTFGGYDKVVKGLFGRSATEMVSDIDKHTSALMSDQTLSEQSNLSGTRGALNTAKFLADHPKLLLQVGGQSLPSMLPILGATRIGMVVAFNAAEKAALAAGRSAATAASMGREASIVAGERAAIIANGVVGGGQTYTQTKQQVMDMSEPDLEKSPIYTWLRKYVNADAAKEVTANLAAEPAAFISAIGDALATKYSGAGKAEAQILNRNSIREKIQAFRTAPAPEAIGSVVGPLMREVGEEVVQSGPSEQGGQNVGIKLAANPDQALGDQVVEQSVMGGMLAAGQTGAMHVAGAAVKPLGKLAPEKAAPIDRTNEPHVGSMPLNPTGPEANVASMPLNPKGQNEPFVVNPPTISATAAAADKGLLFHEEPTIKTAPNVESAKEPAPAKASVAAAAAEPKNAPIPAADLLGHVEVAENVSSEPPKTPEIVKQEVPQPGPAPVVPPNVSNDKPAPGIVAIPTDQIKTDAKTFQFRSEVNDKGVDERLSGVKQWDPMKAGTLIVYEKANGEKIVADGHHRLDLAKQLGAPTVNAFVLREKDGYTPDQVRTMAAMTNIAQGNASPIDTANIFRNSSTPPDQAIAEAGLPPNGALVKQGRDLARLSDETFDMVQKGVISPRDGAIIGKTFSDPEQQRAALKVFAKTTPSNAEEAEIIARQIKDAGFSQQTAEQGGLFGSELETDSLLGERAKIINNLGRALQADAALFKTLQNNAGKISEAGNKLNEKGNAAIADRASFAREQVLNRAFTDPELKAKLDQAARDYKANPGKLGSIIGELKGAIRDGAKNESEQGRLGANQAGGTGRGQVQPGRARPGQSARPSGTGSAAGAQAGAAGAQTGQAVTTPAVSPAAAKAKADLEDALNDLGEIFRKVSGTKNLIEIDAKALLPVLTRLFDAAFRLGFEKFKDAARFALNTIREKFGKEAADSITLDHLQGAYIAMRGNHPGAETAKAVANVESLAEINAPDAGKKTGLLLNDRVTVDGKQGVIAGSDEGENTVTVDTGGGEHSRVKSHETILDTSQGFPRDVVDAINRASEVAQHFKPHDDHSGERLAIRTRAFGAAMDLGARIGNESGGEVVPIRKEKKMVFLMGLPASGKSSVAKVLQRGFGARVIDSDLVKRELPEFDNGIGGPALHLESVLVKNLMMESAMSDGENILYPGVGKTIKSITAEIFDFATRHGYQLYVVQVDLPIAKSIDRSIKRFRQNGQFVPPDYIASVGQSPNQNFDIIKSDRRVSGYAKYSNDVPLGQKPRKVEGTDLEALAHGPGGAVAAGAPNAGSGQDDHRLHGEPPVPEVGGQTAGHPAETQGQVSPTVDVGAHAAATSPKNDLAQPTQAQKEAGNYQKGPLRFLKRDVSIENPEGSQRSNLDVDRLEELARDHSGTVNGSILESALRFAKEGNYIAAIGKLKRSTFAAANELAKGAWANEMTAHYGYMRRTVGGDGEQMDLYIKPGTPLDYDGPVFVIDQKKIGNGHFDEHKIMAGYDSQAEAEAAYKSNYSKGWDGVKAITTFTDPEFQHWLDHGDTTAQASKAHEASASETLADWVTKRLHDGTKFTSRELFDHADKAFKGTQAQGTYTPKDAYDAMELGVNRHILQSGVSDGHGPKTAVEIIKRLEKMLQLLPTQTKRTQEMDEFQQFSTPPTHAYLAAWVANIKSGETVLEPSAGIGGLAVFAKNAGANVIVNELSARRAAVLKTLGFRTFTENAEQLHNILPDDVKPTVVIMNPPFSATAGRMQGTRSNVNGAQHIEQALKRLEPGGRLVAIVGEGMAADKPAFKAWWKRIAAEYNVRANIGINGESYAKYGTTFDNQILVIDKTGPTPVVSGSDKLRGAKPAIVTGQVETPADAVNLLEGVRNERSGSSEQSAGQPSGQGAVDQTGNNARPGNALPPATGTNGGAQQPVEPAGKVESKQSAGQPAGGRPGPSGQGTVGNGSGGRGHQRPGPQGAKPAGGSAVSGERVAEPGIAGATSATPVSPGVEVTAKEAEKAKGELTDAVFEEYKPQLLHIPGARKHPSPLVQSAAMASVLPPIPTYQPNLPKDIASPNPKGTGISEAGMEAVVYAGQAHQQFLHDGSRRGFFIGDGTGTGKGREVAGVILDNWNSGRKKAIWVSEKQGLIEDAKRDLRDVGGDPETLFNQNKTSAPNDIKNGDGILFTTYNTLRGAEKANPNEKRSQKIKTRVQQILDWAGPDFDGVIAFDEAHNMANAVAQKGKRGIQAASLQALAGLELQRKLPKARVIYVSATGATEVSNLAYAERLGLWGPGTSFATAKAFVSEIEQAGVSAMELVSRDMKAMGAYISRQLSFDGVTYGRIEHQLTPLQTDVYNELANAWQTVLGRINEAMEASGSHKNGMARAAALSAFWGNHQRFFNQIITAMQMPSVIEQMHKDLEKGDAPVLQMVNTNEATQARQLAGMKEGDILEDLDLTPRDQLMQYIANGFPVQQYEEYTDEEGNLRSRPVVDAAGNPVFNREAIAMRERLLQTLRDIRVPDGPLEMLLNTFGADKVAEVTGRKERVYRGVNDAGEPVMVREKRGKAAAAADAEAFINDKKRILIFSDAGGTGFSYHADLSKPNQRHRSHYLVQPGWRADKAVQGLGRTHRTNQASAPHVWLPTTNLKAQKRFISSIARRLDQLGALTKGQRQAASQGIFQAKDNLESTYAYAAVRQLFLDLHHGRVEGMTFREMENALGLNGLVNKETGALNEDKLPGVPQFLNRLLSLTTDMQDKVFDMFFHRMEGLIEVAAQHGTLDMGLQTLKALKVRKLSDDIVHTEKQSGAQTRHVQLETTHETPITPLAHVMAMLKGNDHLSTVGFYERIGEGARAGEPFVVVSAGTNTDEQGNVTKALRAYTPQGVHYGLKEEAFDKDRAKVLDTGELKDSWAAAIEKAPKTYTKTDHLFTGAILPVWDRMDSDSVQVVRTVTEDGERLLGRWVPPKQVNEILKNLGQSPVAKMTPQQVHDAIVKDGLTAKLANGWTLKRVKVANDNRIEVDTKSTYPSSATMQEIRGYGGFVERIAFNERLFMPTDNIDALGKLMDTRPVADILGKKPDEAAFSRGTGQGMGADDVNAVIAPIKAAAKNLPPIHVVANPEVPGVPKALREQIKAQGAEGDVAGAFHEGEIWLFHDFIRDPEHAQFVLLHELTHFGLHGVFGPEIDPVLMQMWMTNPDIRKQAGERMAKFNLSRVRAVEEVLADMGGNNVQPTLWQKFVGFVRNWLRRNGFTAKFVKGLNDADVANIVRQAAQYWKKGEGKNATHLYRDAALSRNKKPVETYPIHYAGQYGEGMTPFVAKQQLSRLTKERPDVDWKIAPFKDTERVELVGEKKALTLTSPTPTELKEKDQAATAAQVAAVKAQKEPPAKKVTAHQVDIFNQQGSLFSRGSAAALATGGLRRPRTGLLDTALRMAGGELLGKHVTGPLYDKLLQWGGELVPEHVKAGIVSDYGLPESYTDRRTEMRVRTQVLASQTKTVVDKLAALNRAESRVAYQWMNTKPDAAAEAQLMAQLPPESRDLLRDVKNDIAGLGKEAVRLGQLSPESFERNNMAYLHRTYAKYELDPKTQSPSNRRAAVKILGEQYKGRGLRDDTTMASIKALNPDWWERSIKGDQADTSLKGKKFLRIEDRAPVDTTTTPLAGMDQSQRLGKLKAIAYLPVGEPIPEKYAGWRQDGVWEARFFDKAGKVGMWRDFTPQERNRMGELDEVRFAVAKTLLMMSRDVETGRFLEWIADNHSKATDTGLSNVLEPSESNLRAYTADSWVQVPTSKIPGTDALAYGKLSGRYIPGPIYNDIRQFMKRDAGMWGAYQSMLRAWKISKTALSPAVHTNNIMANFVMADAHDVRARDVVRAVGLYLSKDPVDARLLDRFRQSGATQGMFSNHELRREILEPLMAELKRELGHLDETPALLRASQIVNLAFHGQIRQAVAAAAHSKVARVASSITNAMIKTYSAEDEVFRLATFVKAIEEGQSDLDAGKLARKAFLDYDINAPWIQALRRTALPFVSFSYRAIPMMLDAAAHKPWKLAKWMLVASALNSLAYMMLGLTGADEDKERALLPDEKNGKIFGIFPKLLRMPWNNHRDPVFLDIRRWVPVGDVVDFGQWHSALPLPSTLMPGGPLVLLGELMANRSLFTGKDISKQTDTFTEKVGKVADYAYKSFAPNIPALPFTYATETIGNAVKGRTDSFGREYSVPQALASTVGVKLATYPKDELARNVVLDFKAKDKEIEANMHQIERELARKGITRKEFDKDIAYQNDKRKALVDETRRKVEGAR